MSTGDDAVLRASKVAAVENGGEAP